MKLLHGTSAKNLNLLLERQILLQRHFDTIPFEALFFKVLVYETKLLFIEWIVFHFFECFFNRGYYFFIHVFSFYRIFKFLLAHKFFNQFGLIRLVFNYPACLSKFLHIKLLLLILILI